jgi:hypothetical protein
MYLMFIFCFLNKSEWVKKFNSIKYIKNLEFYFSINRNLSEKGDQI